MRRSIEPLACLRVGEDCAVALSLSPECLEGARICFEPLARLRERGWGEGLLKPEKNAKTVLATNRSRSLRGAQTEAEQCLWYHLRGRRFMGLKFKRQKPIGPYIADFVCLEVGLVIEADGGQHGDAADARRDKWMEAQGLTVLRFWNHDVLQQTDAVLERIRLAVLEKSQGLEPRSSGLSEEDGPA